MSKNFSTSSHSGNTPSGLENATKINGGIFDSDFSPKLPKHADHNTAITENSPNEVDEEEETLLDDDRRALLDGNATSNRIDDGSGVNEREMDETDADNPNNPNHFGASGSHVSNWKYMSRIFIETMPSLVFAIAGSLLTGELLELLSSWEAFKAVDELVILVPMLLNLKGNLEMNLSARLSTASNMGDLDSRRARKWLIIGNLAVLQVQALLVSFVASGVSFGMGRLLRFLEPPKATLLGPTLSSSVNGTVTATAISAISTVLGAYEDEDEYYEGERDVLSQRNAFRLARTFIRLIARSTITTPPSSGITSKTKFDISSGNHRPVHRPPSKLPTGRPSGRREFLVVLLTSLTAASSSSLILGSFVCALIVLCRYFRLNPDNIAIPVASALGDLTTLVLIGLASHFLFPLSNIALLTLVFVFYIPLLLGCLIASLRNKGVRHLLKEGWTPLLGAMAISSGTGMILDNFVSKYKDYGLVTVVQGGIPGSVGSIYISRLSTALHEAQADMELEKERVRNEREQREEREREIREVQERERELASARPHAQPQDIGVGNEEPRVPDSPQSQRTPLSHFRRGSVLRRDSQDPLITRREVVPIPVSVSSTSVRRRGESMSQRHGTSPSIHEQARAPLLGDGDDENPFRDNTNPEDLAAFNQGIRNHDLNLHHPDDHDDDHNHSHDDLTTPLAKPPNPDTTITSTQLAIANSRPRVTFITLFLVTIPIQILFLTTAYAVQWITLPFVWVIAWMICFDMNVFASLGISHGLTVMLWRNWGLDPDTYALPIQSSLVDLVGQTLLVTCYELVGFFVGGVRTVGSRG